MVIMFDALFSYRPPSASGEAKKKNEVDYNKSPTKLFKRVEGRAWESALERIQTNPIEAKIWVSNAGFDGSVNWRRLALHEACMKKPTPKIIETLIQAYQTAPTKLDSDGRLPLHHACANGASVVIVEQLLVAYPEGMELQDSWKKTPLQTLMAQYFPDPHCISALKRGVEYYKAQRRPIPQFSSASSISRSPSSGSLGQTTFPPQQHHSSYSLPNTTSHIPRSIQDGQMINGLQGEIGRYSEKLALNMDKEQSMFNRMRMLEGEINRLLSKDADNIRLEAELRDVESELRSANDALDCERLDTSRNMQVLEDVQRSEDRLKQQLDNMVNDPRQRMLEDKVNQMTVDMREKDNKYEREMQNMKYELQNAAREADRGKSDATKFENECSKIGLEMQRMKYEKTSIEDKLQDFKRKTENMNKMKREMADFDDDRRNSEDLIRDLSYKLKEIEGENARLHEDKQEVARIQDELHSQANYVFDLEEKLRVGEDAIDRLKDELNSLSHAEREERESSHMLRNELHVLQRENEKMKLNEDDVERLKGEMEGIRTEKNDLRKTADDLEVDIRIAKRTNLDLSRDADKTKKQLGEAHRALAGTEKSMNEHKKKEVTISLELHKLQAAMQEKIAEFKQKWLDEQSKCRQLTTKSEDLESEVLQLREQAVNVESSSTAAVSSLSDLQQKINDQEQDIKSLTSKNETLELEIEQKDCDAETKIKEMQAMLEQLNTEKKSLLESKENSDTEQRVLEDTIASLETMLRSQISKAEAPIDQLKTEKQLLEEEKDLLEEEKQLHEEEKQLHEEDSKKKSAEIDSLNQTIFSLNKKLDDLAMEMEKHSIDNMRVLVTKRDELLYKVDDLEGTLSSLLKRLEEEKQLHEESDKKKSAEVESLNQTICSLNKKLDDLAMETEKNSISYEKQTRALATERDEFLHKINNLERTHSSLLKPIENHEGSIAVLKDDFDRKKTVLLNENRAIEDEKMKVQSMYTDAMQKIVTIETLTSESLALEKLKYDKARSAVVALKGEIEQLNREKDSFTGQGSYAIDSMQDEKSRLRVAIDHAMEVNENLEVEKRDFERQKADVEARLIEIMNEKDTAKRELIDVYKDAIEQLSKEKDAFRVNKQDESITDICSMQDEISRLEVEMDRIVKVNRNIELEKRSFERDKAYVEDRLIEIMKERDAAKRELDEFKGTSCGDSGGVPLKDNESLEMLTKLNNREKENVLLRAMLEDFEDDKSSDSLDDIQIRLFALEERKDAEIAVLVEEKDELLHEITTLKEHISNLESGIETMRHDYNTRSSAIERLKQKRDQKKKTIEERLRDYEARSCAGSVVSFDKVRARMEKDDSSSSIISGISYDMPMSYSSSRSLPPVGNSTLLFIEERDDSDSQIRKNEGFEVI